MSAGGGAYSHRRIQREIAAGAPVSAVERERGDARLPAHWVLQTGSFTLTGIVWLLWLHSSYSLLRHAGTKVTRFSPGWAIGCWFLPLVNLVRPYQIVRELLLRSRGLNASAEPIARPSADGIGARRRRPAFSRPGELSSGRQPTVHWSKQNEGEPPPHSQQGKQASDCMHFWQAGLEATAGLAAPRIAILDR
jgi:Domain of unknown function (DUF4328)